MDGSTMRSRDPASSSSGGLRETLSIASLTARGPRLTLSTPVLGALLGNYRIVEALGEGGMGVVYVGRHETLGRRVVDMLVLPALNEDRAQGAALLAFERPVRSVLVGGGWPAACRGRPGLGPGCDRPGSGRRRTPRRG